LVLLSWLEQDYSAYETDEMTCTSLEAYKYRMFLYVIGSDGDRQKIGFSKDVDRRLRSLQTGNPAKLRIHHVEPVPENRVRVLERKLHRELNHKRLKGEWFDLTPTEATQFLQHAVIRWLDDQWI